MKNFVKRYREHFLATVRLSWPIFTGQLGQVMMGVLDTAMVGRVGKDELAAAGASNAVFMTIAVFGIGLSTAISPLVSMAHSAGNKRETAGILQGAYRASLLVSIVIQLLLSLLILNFDWFNQKPSVSELSVSYLQIIGFSVLPMVGFLCIKQFCDGLGNTWPAMLITLIGVPANALFNWVFIYGKWGFPEMGLDGAGYATLLVRILMFVAIIVYVHQAGRMREFVREKPERSMKFFKNIMRMGIPSGFQYFFEIAAFGGAALMAGWIGVGEQAAHQVAINLASLTYMGATGVSAAGGIRVGAAVARKVEGEIRLAGFSAVYIGVIWMTLSGLIFLVFREQLVGLYTSNEEVSSIAMRLMLIAALFQLSDGIQCIGLGILRGLSDVRIPTLFTFLAYWAVGLPLGYLLGFHTSMGIDGIWIALLIALTISASLLTWRFSVLSRPGK